MKYLNETAPFEFSFHQYLKQQNLNLDLKTVTLGKKKKKKREIYEIIDSCFASNPAVKPVTFFSTGALYGLSIKI